MMTSFRATDNAFEEADRNRDGRLDQDEFRNMMSKTGRVTSPTSGTVAPGNDYNYRANPYERYGNRESTVIPGDLTNEMPVKSKGPDDTKRYLQNLGNSVFVDQNPKVIRKSAIERPLTYEQRIMLRCLQPPPIPQVEPLIIKEVRPEQPPPPPPLVIRENGICATQPPPIVLRERPPVPPPRTPGETVIRHLPPIPLPPRSVVVERFPDCPEKPRDIIIERWLPYSSDSERPKIVQPAPPPIKYPAPTHTIVIYDAVQPNIVRKFERLGVTQEDPEAYVSRYGTSLLDRDTLLQRARAVGVVEDLTCSSAASVGVSPPRTDYGKSNEYNTHGSPTLGTGNYGTVQRIPGVGITNPTNGRYSSSSSQGYPSATRNSDGGEFL